MSLLLRSPVVLPVLSPEFRPAYLGERGFLRAVESCGTSHELHLALEREDGKVARLNTAVLPAHHKHASDNAFYAERLVKMLLWQKGGFRLWFCGPRDLGRYLAQAYGRGGMRQFDAGFMAQVYGVERFEVVLVDSPLDLPPAQEGASAVGGHLGGCRIGFDAGGSDRKVAAVIDGREVFSQEVVWHPKTQADPQYHFDGVADALRAAAAHLPRVDAVGISSAGVFVKNQTKIASLFRKVPPDAFGEKIRTLYLDVCRSLFGDVAVEVRNDGDVAALAGAMNLGATRVLGIAMGTSEAAGYIDEEGLIAGWLNELAFAPVDLAPEAPRDTDWSTDAGIGSQYLSQDAAIRLAERAGIQLPASAPPAEKLRHIQGLLEKEDSRAHQVLSTIGVFLGYGLLHYSRHYEIDHVLLLGRVTSGASGSILKTEAERVLKVEAPEFFDRVAIHLPDETNRRVGQSIAAASLPALREERMTG